MLEMNKTANQKKMPKQIQEVWKHLKDCRDKYGALFERQCFISIFTHYETKIFDLLRKNGNIQGKKNDWEDVKKILEETNQFNREESDLDKFVSNKYTHHVRFISEQKRIRNLCSHNANIENFSNYLESGENNIIPLDEENFLNEIVMKWEAVTYDVDKLTCSDDNNIK